MLNIYGLKISLLLSTYVVDDGEHLHILYVRATELQQALREINHQIYVASFKSVISVKDFRITIYIID